MTGGSARAGSGKVGTGFAPGISPRSDDEGYTLAECLVALFVIGLAMAGLSAGGRIIGRQQERAIAIARGARDLRAVHEDLDLFLERQGPFIGPGADTFSGASSRFQFPCGDQAQRHHRRQDRQGDHRIDSGVTFVVHGRVSMAQAPAGHQAAAARALVTA